MALKAPSINNTISAFNRNDGEMKIFFSFSGAQGDSRADIFLVRLMYAGQSMLQDGTVVAYTVDDIDAQDVHLKAYQITIQAADLTNNYTEGFPLNTPMQVSIAAIANGASITAGGADDWLADNSQNISSWSETVIKYAIAEPTFNIWLGYFERPISAPRGNFNTGTSGEAVLKDQDCYSAMVQLSFNTPAEYDEIASYQIKVFQSTDTVLYSKSLLSSGKCYPDKTWDATGRTIYYKVPDPSNFIKDITVGSTITVTIAIRTQKGYIYTQQWTFKVEEATSGVNSGLIIDETVSHMGIIGIQRGYIEGVTDSDDLILTRQNLVTSQDEVIFKGKMRWSEATDTVIDWTPAYNTYYHYKLKKNGTVVAKTAAPVRVCFDQGLLISRHGILQLPYNLSITNLKDNIQTVITPTLGGSYPFVRRSGEQKYRSFSISALLSFECDVGDQFDAENPFGKSWLINFGSQKINVPAAVQGLTGYDRWCALERIYRDTVIDFLYKDQVVLFKSPTEGNMFVILTDISFAPNESLGRNIYTFTATATEVAPCNSESYLKYLGQATTDNIEYTLATIYARLANTDTAASNLLEGTLTVPQTVVSGTTLQVTQETITFDL